VIKSIASAMFMLANVVALAAEPVEVTTAGFGRSSCASWKEDEAAGTNWLLGYWTGRNIEGLRKVGTSTDGNGIIEEVRLICNAQPSLRLMDATTQVYQRFMSEGR
jgi:hypothetical protein